MHATLYYVARRARIAGRPASVARATREYSVWVEWIEANVAEFGSKELLNIL